MSVVTRVAVSTLVLMLAIALGSALAYVGDQVLGTSSASVRPRPATTSVPTLPLTSRQFVLGYVRGLSAIIPRAQRFEAKLVSYALVLLIRPIGQFCAAAGLSHHQHHRITR